MRHARAGFMAAGACVAHSVECDPYPAAYIRTPIWTADLVPLKKGRRFAYSGGSAYGIALQYNIHRK